MNKNEKTHNTALKISDLSHYYDREKVLDSISINVKKGEKIAIIGPNGAGKTTLFLHMNGTFKNEKNKVFIDGKDIIEMNIKERVRNVGVVFADPDDQLFMPTVYDDVAFGPLNLDLPNKEVDERVNNAFEMTGIRHLADRVPHHLSMGQKKKVALASVLSLKPNILVLDEPTANLDPKSRNDIIEIIQKLNKEGITTIVSTHDINLLSKMADRIYILNRKILKEGTPQEIFEDEKFLSENNLEAPEIYMFFKETEKFGMKWPKYPLSIEEALVMVQEIKKE